MFELSNDPLWYVIYTKPKQENRAFTNLSAFGVETLFPQIYKCGKVNLDKWGTVMKIPLFPRYIFAKFNALRLYQKVHFTRGVHSIVASGMTPCPVDENIIEIIKTRCEEGDFVNPEKKIKPGDNVRITKPYLEDFVGIFEKELNDRERVSILINAVNYQAHVVVEKGFVEPADL